MINICDIKSKYILLSAILGCLVLSGCSVQNTQQTPDKTHIYTAEDIYLLSFQCGYISQDEKPDGSILIIENEEQLAIAEERYGLALSEGKRYYNTSIIDAFQKMKSMYSLDEYTYVVEYVQTSSGMLNYNVDKLVIDGDSLYFKLDDKAQKSNNYESVTQDMSGWCYLAALPKDILEGKTFTTATRPYEDSQIDIFFEDFISGKIPAIRINSQERFYITELNMNPDEWDSFRIGERIDLDNDGEKELIMDGPYGGIYLDVNNEHVIAFAEGEGSAFELSYVYYDDAYWIVKSDTTHAGRQMYSFTKYSGADCIVDSFELSAEYWEQDAYDENTGFTYRGEEISMKQYEQIYNDIVSIRSRANP